MALAKEREEKGLSVGNDPSAIPEFKDANKAYLRARAQYLFAARALNGAISRYAVADTQRLLKAEQQRDLEGRIGQGEFDAVVTSPPCNSTTPRLAEYPSRLWMTSGRIVATYLVRYGLPAAEVA